MAGARSTNTFSEFLQRMIADISAAMTMPDADLEWLANQQMAMVEKARSPIAAQQQAGMSGTMPGGAPPMGMPMPPGPGMPPMPPGMPMGGQMPGAPPMPGGGIDMNIAVPVGGPGGGPPRDMSAVGMDDELRRLVGQ